MKRFLLTGLLILGLGQFATYAQQRGTYRDDIYYNSKDAQKEAEAQKKRAAAAQEARRLQQEQERTNDENTYSSTGGDLNSADDGSTTYRRSYQSDADGDGYLDANDDFYYTSRVRRFGYYSSPGFGYYSPFYDPFWYGPGYGYGYGSGISVTIGWGPSWGGYWGPGYGWYGYPYGWGYPYGYGWCAPYTYGWGYPYGGYWGHHHHHGFYDGYYGGGGYGGYGGYGSYRSVYGPRSSVSSNSYGPRVNSSNSMPQSGGLIRQQRTSAPNNGTGAITNEPAHRVRTGELPDHPISNQESAPVERRSRRFEPSQPVEQQQMQRERRMQRSRYFGSPGGQNGRVEPMEQRAPQRMERQERSYEQPRYQQSAPSYQRMQSSPAPRSAPMSSPGGGSFGGGRRR